MELSVAFKTREESGSKTTMQQSRRDYKLKLNVVRKC